MPKITGRVYDIGLAGSKGTMWLSAGFRTGTDGVIAPRRRSYPIVNGQLPDNVVVEPGPAYLEIDVGLDAHGDWPVVIPDTDVTLADLISDAFDWSPVELTLFAQLRIAAREAADDAEQARDTAVGAAQDTVEARDVATGAAGTATEQAGIATDKAAAAAQSEQAAADSEAAAADSEQAAATSEGKALEHRTVAGQYREVTVEAGAGSAQSAGTAASHATAAGTARAQAEAFAQQASESRIIWRGDWDPATTYATRDAVHHTGSTWRALRPNTGIPPVAGADWALMAERGLSYGDQIKLDTDGVPYLDIDPDYSSVPQAVLDRVADAETAAGTAGGEADRARAEADRARDYATAQDSAIAGLVATDSATRAELDARYLAGGVRESQLHPGLYEIGPAFLEDAIHEGTYLIPRGDN